MTKKTIPSAEYLAEIQAAFEAADGPELRRLGNNCGLDVLANSGHQKISRVYMHLAKAAVFYQAVIENKESADGNMRLAQTIIEAIEND